MTDNDRREQERTRRRRDILLAAREVFALGGYRRSTVDQVARRAGIAKGTTYLYFESKEAILAELVLEALAELSAQLEAAERGRAAGGPDERLRAMAEAYLAFSLDAPDYFRFLTAFEGGALERGLSPQRQRQIVDESNRVLDLVAAAVDEGMASGLYEAGDARQAAAVLWAALNGVLTLMAHPIRRAVVVWDLPGLYRATLALCLRGLIAR